MDKIIKLLDIGEDTSKIIILIKLIYIIPFFILLNLGFSIFYALIEFGKDFYNNLEDVICNIIFIWRNNRK